MSTTVECVGHGEQAAAFVCQHLVKSLEDGKARGLIWSLDEDDSYNAYCSSCETLLEENGGEWTEPLEEVADIKVICEVCMKKLFVLNNQTGAI